jgi:hypothetical protein
VLPGVPWSLQPLRSLSPPEPREGLTPVPPPAPEALGDAVHHTLGLLRSLDLAPDAPAAASKAAASAAGAAGAGASRQAASLLAVIDELLGLGRGAGADAAGVPSAKAAADEEAFIVLDSSSEEDDEAIMILSDSDDEDEEAEEEESSSAAISSEEDEAEGEDEEEEDLSLFPPAYSMRRLGLAALPATLVHRALKGHLPPSEQRAGAAAQPLPERMSGKQEGAVLRALAHLPALGSDSVQVGRWGRDSVSLRSLRSLRDGEWLNDEVINFFVRRAHAQNKQWQAAGTEGQLALYLGPKGPSPLQYHRDGSADAADPNVPSRTLPRCYVHSSMFLAKLLSPAYQYADIRNWTTREPLDWGLGDGTGSPSAVEWIVVPLHLSVHWAVAVVDLGGRGIHYYDSMARSSAASYAPYTRALVQWLRDDSEHKMRLKAQGGAAAAPVPQPFVDATEWPVFAHPRSLVPQQDNDYDCGVFAISFLQALVAGKRWDFSQSTMPRRRCELILDIISTNEPLSSMISKAMAKDTVEND